MSKEMPFKRLFMLLMKDITLAVAERGACALMSLKRRSIDGTCGGSDGGGDEQSDNRVKESERKPFD